MLLRGNRNLVKLDIDSPELPRLAPIVAKLHRAGYRIRWMSQQQSPGGKGWHLVLKLRPCPKTAVEVVALQAILGSDPFREAANLWRAHSFEYLDSFWRDRWNVLYSQHLSRRK